MIGTSDMKELKLQISVTNQGKSPSIKPNLQILIGNIQVLWLTRGEQSYILNKRERLEN